MTTSTPHPKQHSILILVVATLITLLAVSFRVSFAQIIEDYVEQKRAASQLYDKGDFVGAAPILEMLARSNPDDIEVMEKLTFSLYASAASIKDPKQRGEVREKVKVYLRKARALGDDSNLMKIVEQGLSVNDPISIPFSNHAEAEAAMRDGEDAFVHGDYDKAIAAYARALNKDPGLDFAAIFTGDVYFKKGMGSNDEIKKQEWLETAGKWFARAISINENRETAYRYWGDALMAQGKMQEAGDKFIDAIIAEPGNRNAYVGLNQWAGRGQNSIGHPAIEQPQTSTTPTDGTGHYWSLYDSKRAAWKTKNFQAEYPHEKNYRHSVKEEAGALVSVAEAVIRDQKDGKAPELDTALTNLVSLYKDGLLEAYVFFNRVDAGIVQDYAGYRILHRDKLHRYWADYVVGGKH